MDHMDDALGTWTPPSAADISIELPGSLGAGAQRSGASGGAGRSSEASGGAGASSAPSSSQGAGDPAPQRDDPDEGEHTRSTAEEAPEPPAPDEEAEQGAGETGEGQDAPGEEEEAVEAADDEPGYDPLSAMTPDEVRRELAGIAGSDPRTFQKTGFSAAGADTLTVKRFPVALVDRLRLSLAPATGGDFAESLSAPAIITAFLVAKTGLMLEVDANTAVAVDVFRQVDPRLLSVEDKLDETLSDVGQLANAMRMGLTRIAEIGNIVDTLDFSTSFLVADRVAGGITGPETNESTVDVTHKKVLTAREAIRARSTAQRKVERNRDGRRMA